MLAGLSSTSFAQEAADVARQFMLQKRQSPARLTLRHATPKALIYENEGGDFVVLTAERPQVIGYGHAPTSHMPLALTNLLKKAGQAAPGDVTTPVVEPLLSTQHDDEAPYNDRCPYYIFDSGTQSNVRCLVGCVAVALEQIMTHYRRTVTLLDTLHGWSTPHYTIPDEMPGQQVDTRQIISRYDGTYTPTQAQAVATLSYWCGMAARMNWGIDESGANIRRLVKPMEQVFGYGYVHHVDSYQFGPAEWRQMLIDELLAGRPVLYAGYLMRMGGHAFVLDGVDKAGFFHVNWGYGGNYDGYFRLDVLNFAEPADETTEEGIAGGFFCNQEALLLHPDSVQSSLPDTLARTGEELRIDSIVFEQKPKSGVYTAARIHVTNTSDATLTTPFEFFTNSPADTALFEQADYLALTGLTLAPGESRQQRIHLKFNESGQRIFRLSPDDIHISFEKAMLIDTSHAPQLTFSPPVCTPQTDGSMSARIDFANAQGAGRSGNLVTYEIVDQATPLSEGPRHYYYLYLEGGEHTSDAVSFKNLKAGHTYKFLVRHPWRVVAEATFTMPATSGIETAENNGQESREATLYRLDGRRAAEFVAPGIYLKRQGNKVTKILIR